jgi:putative transcriptional regulator
LSPRKHEPRLYNRLPVLRAERGLSRQDLADAVEVNYQTIGYLERGEYNPSLELALRIAELFGVPIEAIFAREPLAPMSVRLYGRQDVDGPISADSVRDPVAATSTAGVGRTLEPGGR